MQLSVSAVIVTRRRDDLGYSAGSTLWALYGHWLVGSTR
jgi:hypothetical protein